MPPSLAVAWRVARRRALANPLTLVAALTTVLLATTLLAAGPIYADAVVGASVQRTLRDAPLTAGNLQVDGPIDDADAAAALAATDARVTAAVEGAVAGVGARVHRSLRSGTFALPADDPSAEVTQLVRFLAYEGIADHATLLEGAWPQGDGVPLEVAVHRAAAAQLGLAIGNEVVLTSRLRPSLEVRVRVVGVYDVDRRDDPFWWADPLEVDGVDAGGSFTERGPLVAPAAALAGPIAGSGLSARWRVSPRVDEVTVDDLGALRARLRGLPARLDDPGEVVGGDLGGGDELAVVTELPRLLAELDRSLLVTRSGVVLATVQLAVLAGYALLFTAGMIIEQRRVETALLRARGADPPQVAGAALLEALALGVPAAVFGPVLALGAVALMGRLGPLADIGLDLDVRLRPEVFAIAALAAVACALVLTIPAARAARTYAEARATRGRQEDRGVAWRSGLDLVVAGIALLGYWQLRRYGAPITRTIHGRLGLDPFLVLAPTLGLLAGGLVSLRLLPRLARLFERGTSRRPDLVPSLGAWQLSRRPARHARATLLVVLALGVSLFSVSYARTWTRSQVDQADHAAGADVRVVPDRRAGTALPSRLQADAHADIPGVRSAMAVHDGSAEVARAGASGTALALDARHADAVVAVRPDLLAGALPDVAAALRESTVELPVIELPGEPEELSLDVTVALEPVGGSTEPGVSAGGSPQPLVVVLRDGDGLLHRVLTERLAADGQRRKVPVSLVSEHGSSVRYPVALAGIEVWMQPGIAARDATITVHGLGLASGSGTAPLPVPPPAWDVDVVPLPDAGVAPAVRTAAGDAQALLRLQVGLGTGPCSFNSAGNCVGEPTSRAVAYRLLVGAPPSPGPLPALATDAYLDASGFSPGETAQLELLGHRHEVTLVARAASFPTVPSDVPALIVDLPSVAQARFAADWTVLEPETWWLDVDPTARRDVAAVLDAPPFSSAEVVDRVALAQGRRSDPVALGILGALLLGSTAAACLAALGFAVAAVVSARERVGEFALLRAMGLSGRQLSGWLSIENGAVVVAGIAGGTALGLLLAWAILPLVSLTPEATPPVPAADLAIPWHTVALVEGVVIALLTVVVVASARGLRRVGLASVIRFGEDR